MVNFLLYAFSIDNTEVNGLNISIKWHGLSCWIERKATSNYMQYTIVVHDKDTVSLKGKRWEYVKTSKH